MTTFNDQPQPFVSSKTARAMARLLADEYGFRVRKVDTVRLMEGGLLKIWLSLPVWCSRPRERHG